MGTEAVQKILDSLDDIVALQDPCVDINVLMTMLTDSRLHSLLQVCKSYTNLIKSWWNLGLARFINLGNRSTSTCFSD